MAVGIGAGIGGVLILIAVILGVLWCIKSKRREKERFERTASMRSSVRSSMRMSKSTLTVLSEGHSRRRLNEIDGYSQASSAATKTSRGTEDLNGSLASLGQPYRNGRTLQDRSLENRRGMERPRWGNGERVHDMDVDRHVRRRRRGEEEEEEDQESYRDSRGREESESEVEKKDFEDSEEEGSFDSDPEEEEDEGAAGRTRSESRPYQNDVRRVPLPGMGLEGLRHTRSRDDIYENQDPSNSPTKSKSLSSFSQPETPDESPVANIFLPRRQDLPTPPPTPRSYANTPDTQRRVPGPQEPTRPRLAPKPTVQSPLTHPAVQQFRESPAPSEASLRSGSGRPSPLPRKNFGGSQGSSPRETPVPYGATRNPEYENQAGPLPPKQQMGSQEFQPRSNIPSLADDQSETYDYKPVTPHMSPSTRLPNLPRYSPPLPMDGPPSYDESDYYRREPDYMNHQAPSSYMPSQDPPEQDVQYLPRRQPDRRQFHGSRDRLDGSRDRLGGSRDHLSGSRDQLSRSRDRLVPPYSPAAYSPNVLYLNNGNRDGVHRSQEHLETEI